MTPIRPRPVFSKTLAVALASPLILGAVGAHAAVFLNNGHSNAFEYCDDKGCYKAQKNWRGRPYDYVFTPYSGSQNPGSQNAGGQDNGGQNTGGQNTGGDPQTGQGQNDNPQGGSQGTPGGGPNANGDGPQGGQNNAGDPPGSSYTYTPPPSNDGFDTDNNPDPNSGSNPDTDPPPGSDPNNGGPITSPPPPPTPPILAKVPEPDVWGLMLVGFGVVGVAIRRRRAPAATAPDTSR